MDSELNQIKQKVRRELADYLGVEQGDIEEDSTLRGDLHMSPTDLTDFFEILKAAGLETEGVELTEIETFEELVDALAAHI